MNSSRFNNIISTHTYTSERVYSSIANNDSQTFIKLWDFIESHDSWVVKTGVSAKYPTIIGNTEEHPAFSKFKRFDDVHFYKRRLDKLFAENYRTHGFSPILERLIKNKIMLFDLLHIIIEYDDVDTIRSYYEGGYYFNFSNPVICMKIGLLTPLHATKIIEFCDNHPNTIT